MSLRDATIDRERRDLASHQVMDESRLIRFVAGPDGQVVPDLGRKLPGRGLWVAADRASVQTAAKKNLFSRAAKTRLAASDDLPDLVERLLHRRVWTSWVLPGAKACLSPASKSRRRRSGPDARPG